MPRPPENHGPMTLANMRANGVRRLLVICHRCGHREVVDANGLDDALTVKSLEPRMRCRRCHLLGAEVRPNWTDRPTPLPLL